MIEETDSAAVATALKDAMSYIVVGKNLEELEKAGITKGESFAKCAYDGVRCDLNEMENFLDNQLPKEIFRSKGILWFQESERRHVFHLTGKRFSINDSDWTGERKNQIVMIGRDINHDSLRQQLQNCVASNHS